MCMKNVLQDYVNKKFIKNENEKIGFISTKVPLSPAS